MNGLLLLRCGASRKRRAAMSLTEVMCVIVIIAILAALYLPAITRAYLRITKFLGGL